MYRARLVKYSKAIMLTAGAVVVLVLVVWFMRNTLVQRMSNPLLQEYGIEVTDVSLAALTTNNATIGHLELVHEKGTSIIIEGLTLGMKTYSAARITIISATRTEDEPFELALLIDQLLSLPGLVGPAELSVAELSVPPYPEIRDLRVVVLDNELRLHATVGPVTMSVLITQPDASNHAVVFSLPGGSPNTPAQSLNASLQHNKESILLDGLASLDLPAWQPLVQLTELLPPEIRLQSGTAAMRFNLEIPYDTRQPVSVTAELTPSGPLQFTYADNGGETTAITVKSGSPVHLTTSFPEGEWSLRQAEASLTVRIAEWMDIPLSIADLSCASGPSCSMHASVALRTEIEASPLSGDMTVSLPLVFENLSVSVLNQVLSAHLSLQQNGSIEVQHNLDTGTGQLTITDASVSFDTRSLSNRVSPWRENWDITAGDLLVDLRANWTQSGTNLTFDGNSSLRLQDLAGHFSDIAFTGLSTTLETAYNSGDGFTVKPSSITVELIEMGLPLENISASYTLYPDDMAFDMADLRIAAFGGVISADPFSFRTASNINTVLMRAEAIQLDRLLTLQEFEAIEVSGTVGAELPVTIVGDSLTIAQGRLFGEPPGGVIRYRPGSAPDETDLSGIGLATLALSNFEYQTLTSEIDYNANGDLKLQLQLTGKNPDLDSNRPVILNLGVENNVPQMLKSLRAARTVEDVLEQRLQQ